MARKETLLASLSRRSVLKRGTAIAVGVGVGIPGLSGSAAATACPRTPGYWTNHDWPSTGLEKVNEKLAVSFETVADGQTFLAAPPRGDKGQIMATHLIATVLNFQNLGSAVDVDETVTDVTGDGDPESFREIKRLAEDWLDASAFPDPQRRWVVTSAPVRDGEVLKDELDAFNNGRPPYRCTL